MQIYKITKGNFALENTRDIRQHENNLRFHIKIEDKYYEYAIDNINKNTINVRCVIGKQKFRQKCYARLTLTVAGYLKTEKKLVTQRHLNGNGLKAILRLIILI